MLWQSLLCQPVRPRRALPRVGECWPMPIPPVRAHPEPRCPCVGCHALVCQGWVLLGCSEPRCSAARRCPKRPHGSVAHPKRCQLLHTYSTRPEVGEQYTGVPGMHERPRRGRAARRLPPVMSRTRFPDSITCVACHTPCCTVVSVTMPLRGPMLPGGTPAGTAGRPAPSPGGCLLARMRSSFLALGAHREQSSGD